MQAAIYNSTDGPLLVDDAGRVLPAREHHPDTVDVTASPVAGHIAAGRIVVTSPADDQAEAPKTPAKGRARTSTPTQEA